MAEHQQGHQLGYQQQQQHPDVIKGYLPGSEKGPSSSQVLAVVTLFPVGAFLLLLAGLTLTGTLVSLAITAPLFVIFSPVLIPALLVIALAVTGVVTSGAFGVTALSSFLWLLNFLRQSRVPEQLEHAKRWTQDTAGQLIICRRMMGCAVGDCYNFNCIHTAAAPAISQCKIIAAYS